MPFYCIFFFFSSRRRHTRLQGDWSSDVCSSDLCTRSATLRNPSRLTRAAPSALPPQANGGTYLGGRTASNTFAPAPITVPVPSRVPIAVLAWSPIKVPRNCIPVSTAVPATSSRTVPYVFFRFDVIVPAPRFTQRPITEWPTNPSCALFAYPRNTQLDTSPRTFDRGPIAEARIAPPNRCAFAPAQSGPSRRAPDRTSTPLSSTTGPWRTSNTTPGSTAASCSAIHAGSPRTVLPAGIASLSPSSPTRSSRSSGSSARITSCTPCSTTPATSCAVACGCGPSQVAPGPTPHPTVIPPHVSRNGPPPPPPPGPTPPGAKAEGPISAGPVTGWRGDTVGTPASANPARWGSAKISATSVPTNASHRSRTRCAPTRSSDSGRTPANGAQPGAGSGSSR